ncbi:MAG: PQQ-binding-like beta-propeller repeat protein [Planctomycetota bacterium]
MIVRDARRRLPGSPCGQRGVVPALVTAVMAGALLPAALATADAPRLPGIGADDWPWWRGPTHDGVAATGQEIPTTWSADRGIAWMAEIPGRGNGSPTVIGDAVYVATCDEATGSQSVIAYDRATGATRWQRQVHAAGAMRKHERSTGASGTVSGDGERLFIAFPNDGAVVVNCLSRGGDVVWRHRLCDYLIHQGYGASPLVHGDTVIVVADHKGGGAVAALDRATGTVRWRRDRPPAPNYSSPIVHRLFGRDQLVLIGCDAVTSHDPATGAVFWERPGATTECVTTPVTDGTRIYTSGGYPRNHVAAIRADGSATLDWENGERVYVPSLLVRDGYLYGILDAGIAACWDAATGKERWKQRLGGNASASPVLVGDTILATDESGTTRLFKAAPERFEAVGENTLGDECFASPAVCGGRIYLRVAFHGADGRREKLVCIGR